MAALSGIRIVDLSMGWAGPLACRHLADMGAEVIKVESCERFDWWRSWEATPEWIESDGAEKSTAFNTVNRNKLNITLDLEDEAGRALLLKLIGTANAVVENYSGGVLPKLKLGYEIFQAVREDIILMSMPAFGATGPWSSFRAYGSTVEQSSGLPHLSGSADQLPVMQHVAYGDAMGGLNGAAALLTALRHQARTGQGQFVDLSQVEALFPLAIHGILHTAVTGANPDRRGNFNEQSVPHGVYPCLGEDEWILIQISTADQWQALSGLAGEALAAFGSWERCFDLRDEIDAALAGWTRSHPAGELMNRLQAVAVPAAACQRASQLLQDPHLGGRGFWQWLQRDFVGLQPNPSAPYTVNGQRVRISRPAPTLGQHNREILREIIGVSETEFLTLEERGVIGTRPRMPGTKPKQVES